MNESLQKTITILKDRRNQALVGFFVIAVLITFATVSQISFNYALEQDQRLLDEQNTLLEQRIAIQKLENQLTSTPYFQELRARDELGLVAPGENIIVYSSPEYATLKDSLNEQFWAIEETVVIESTKSNLERWLLFFSGKDPS